MPFKFCPNISFLFNDIPFAQRYQQAKVLGFQGVESGFPYNVDPKELVEAKVTSGLEHILLNIYTGDTSKGELGCACIPDKSSTFDQALDKAIDLAKLLNCKKIHLMSGKIVGERTEKNDEAYLSNISRAVKKLEENSIIGLIEPINNITVPDYYMNNYDQALNVIKTIDSPNLKLMLDIFHLQQICGNITYNIQKLLPYTGHVQIAQVPYRHEPNSAGEIDYKFVLRLLESLNYHNWVGLEYNYKDGFGWISEFGFKL
uniref:Putative hydroxypyruvate isomerase n=1 Tax=Xenopsylla cheopis TaxID=163159 RepID=A0A6M2DPN0_XENCH